MDDAAKWQNAKEWREDAMCGKHGGGPWCQEDARQLSAKTHEQDRQNQRRTSVESPEPQVTDMVKQQAVNEAVGNLTGDAASRGLRLTGHITSISDDVKSPHPKGA